METVWASSAPVNGVNVNQIIYDKKPKSEESLLYIPKDQEKKQQKSKIIYNPEAIKIENPQKKEETKQKETPNIKVSDVQIIKNKDEENWIISTSSRKISAIYPDDENTLKNNYPGYRGPNQLVIYTKKFGETTSTNEFGKEAVVVNNMVVKLTGANSQIPRNGFVISGHGTGKKWISDNLRIGTKIEIKDRLITAYTTLDSYRYCAKAKIDEVEDILLSTKADYTNRDDKNVYYFLKKAKQQYKKSLKDESEASLNCAKEAIENATIAYRYTVPYIPNELKGVWIRPTEKTPQEVIQTLDKIKSTGINSVFLETYYHGRTIFPSNVMKSYGFEEQNSDFNFDALAVWTKEAHKRGMKIHTWFESFYVGNKQPLSNPKSILAVKPDWQNKTKQKADFEGYIPHPNEHNGYFLDPANPEVVNFLLNLIREIVTRYDVDGVNIDYVRYPNIAKENTNNQWGYTPFAREEFKQTFGVDPVEIEYKSSYWDEWCIYRRDKISNYVKRASMIIRNGNKVISTVIFPDYRVSLQTKHQDWTRWTKEKYVDAITPLILTSDDNLAKSMLEEIKKKTEEDVLTFPGLFAGFIESDPEDLLRQIHIIRKLKLNGIMLFDWAHLNENYINALKTNAFRSEENPKNKN